MNIATLLVAKQVIDGPGQLTLSNKNKEVREMKHSRRVIGFISLAALTVFLSAANGVNAQNRPFLSLERPTAGSPASEQAHIPKLVHRCKGPITQVMDVAYENVKTTAFNWSNTTGGGESGRFDPTPLLSTRVVLTQGSCLDAHLSAMVGSQQTYGAGVAAITMFQVTLTPLIAGGMPQHMVGHYENPWGIYGPAVAHEAERDVDMYASNFFQKVGTLPGDVPPGAYRVDVWWSGGLPSGGAIGADFVLKLYLR